MAKKTVQDYIFYGLIYLILFFATAAVSSRLILRGEIVTVPNLVGRTLDEAKAEGVRKRTAVAVQGYEYDSRTERGRVIAQDPPAASRIKTGRTIRVMLSEGSQKVAVPRLEGRSLEWSSTALKEAGLRRGRVAQIHTSRYAAGRVIVQHPAPESTADRGSPVNLLISQGAREPRYIMPDLIEKNSNEVLRQLRAMGFKVAEIHPSYYAGAGPGIIIRQSPLAGTKIQRQTQISLEVSK